MSQIMPLECRCSDGKLERSWTFEESGAEPGAIAVEDRGLLYVVDGSLNKVSVCSANGLLATVGIEGQW